MELITPLILLFFLLILCSLTVGITMFIKSSSFSKYLPSFSGIMSGRWDCLGEDVLAQWMGKLNAGKSVLLTAAELAHSKYPTHMKFCLCLDLKIDMASLSPCSCSWAFVSKTVKEALHTFNYYSDLFSNYPGLEQYACRGTESRTLYRELNRNI